MNRPPRLNGDVYVWNYLWKHVVVNGKSLLSLFKESPDDTTYFKNSAGGWIKPITEEEKLREQLAEMKRQNKALKKQVGEAVSSDESDDEDATPLRRRTGKRKAETTTAKKEQGKRRKSTSVRDESQNAEEVSNVLFCLLSLLTNYIRCCCFRKSATLATTTMMNKIKAIVNYNTEKRNNPSSPKKTYWRNEFSRVSSLSEVSIDDEWKLVKEAREPDDIWGLN